MKQQILMQTFSPTPDGKYNLTATYDDQISSQINYCSTVNFFFLDKPKEIVRLSDTIEYRKEGAFVNGREIGSLLPKSDGQFILYIPQPKNLRDHETLQPIDPQEIDVVIRKGGPRLYVNDIRVVSEKGFNDNITLYYKDNSKKLTRSEKSNVEYKNGKFYVGDREIIRGGPRNSPYPKKNSKKSPKTVSNAEKNSASLLDLAIVAEQTVNSPPTSNSSPLPSIRELLPDYLPLKDNKPVSTFQSSLTFFSSSRVKNKTELSLDVGQKVKPKL